MAERISFLEEVPLLNSWCITLHCTVLYCGTFTLRLLKFTFQIILSGDAIVPLQHHITIISYYIISYYIISYHIISYHTISYHIIPYHIISYDITLYHFISYHTTHLVMVGYSARYNFFDVFLIVGFVNRMQFAYVLQQLSVIKLYGK